ncbi:hypothetical protein EV144_101113 [Flavobacterium sp. 270]|uniref:hypothetical protein n=1 Tax=Flavobacterium sp. 270 TaxID=2512114 RepID=UPI001064F655|nr:hypothetical protein [Flavobacterium sp. 270]TDW51438.1 hypothetical protein EV144_101113 [Flavobacterium sp. 270]
MSFFQKLFGIKSQGEQKNNELKQIENKQIESNHIKTTGNPFFTNAPKHWPVITDDFLNSNKDFSNNFDNKTGDIILKKRMFMVNSLVLMGKLNEELSVIAGKKITHSYRDSLIDNEENYATTFCIDKVFELGIIKTHGIVIENSKKYAIILFHNSESINYINELKKLFLEEGFEDLIYYATVDPASIIEINPKEIEFETINQECFHLDKEKQSKNDRKYSQYALWCSRDSIQKFIDSKVYKSLNEYHNYCSDCYTYILGKIGFALGLNENDKRVQLPEYDELIFEGPEGVEIIMTISNKNGLNFHFPANSKFDNYRNNFLNIFTILCKTLKEQIDNENFEKDNQIVTTEWLERLKSEVIADEKLSFISLIRSDSFHPNLN